MNKRMRKKHYRPYYKIIANFPTSLTQLSSENERLDWLTTWIEAHDMYYWAFSSDDSQEVVMYPHVWRKGDKHTQVPSDEQIQALVTMLDEHASQYRVVYYGLTRRGYQEKPAIGFEKNV